MALRRLINRLKDLFRIKDKTVPPETSGTELLRYKSTIRELLSVHRYLNYRIARSGGTNDTWNVYVSSFADACTLFRKISNMLEEKCRITGNRSKTKYRCRLKEGCSLEIGKKNRTTAVANLVTGDPGNGQKHLTLRFKLHQPCKWTRKK